MILRRLPKFFSNYEKKNQVLLSSYFRNQSAILQRNQCSLFWMSSILNNKGESKYKNLCTNRSGSSGSSDITVDRGDNVGDSFKTSENQFMKLRNERMVEFEKHETAYPSLCDALPREADHTKRFKYMPFKQFTERFSYLKNGEKKIPNKIHKDNTIHSSENNSDADTSSMNEEEYFIVGRIIAKRKASSKLTFYTISDGEGTCLQVMASKGYYTDNNEFDEINQTLKRGDIISVKGFPGKTGTGELSVVPTQLKLLSPCLHQIPHYRLESLENHDIRYRQRYLDFITNKEQVRKVFEMRTKIIKYIRNFFDQKGYMEVETPILFPSSGGATAKPFKTYLNAMNMDLKLRIAPELFLKQLVIGGFERVYEIGKIFRNEGIDSTHNPEFTSIECYEAYADYETYMSMTEELLSGLVKMLTGTNHIHITNQKNENLLINFSVPFKRVSLASFFKEQLSIVNGGETGVETVENMTAEALLKICEYHKIQVHSSSDSKKKQNVNNKAYLMDQIVSHVLEPQCIDPTFLCDHPIELSPLAKQHHTFKGYTERFELFINGRELCNAYSELNDPREQRRRFLEQAKLRDEYDDQEAHEMDENFCRALEYGLPPTAGWGCGIDRLVMLMTNTPHIRDVLFFPLAKPVSPTAQQNDTTEENE